MINSIYLLLPVDLRNLLVQMDQEVHFSHQYLLYLE